jgi:hypothetical protein
MRIAQIAPLYEAVPPKLYGGTERVVSFLTEELVALGHDVTLFASGDSVSGAELDAAAPLALRLDPAIRDPLAVHMMQLEAVRRRAGEFDIMDFHMDYLCFSTQLGPAPNTTRPLYLPAEMPICRGSDRRRSGPHPERNCAPQYQSFAALLGGANFGAYRHAVRSAAITRAGQNRQGRSLVVRCREWRFSCHALDPLIDSRQNQAANRWSTKQILVSRDGADRFQTGG